MNDDLDLLRAYSGNGSEEAFATLVSRYINLVYSVAIRQVRDPQAADEVTQAVFIILARKAASLGDGTILSAWLCRTARYACANALTMQRRRERREEAYMRSNPASHAPEPAWDEMMPILDGAMEKLGRKDHDALVLRFFEGHDFKNVGVALGVSEGAAKVRVGRALEKLRQIFSRRGVESTASAIEQNLSRHSVQAAPVVLAKAVTVVAVAKGAAASASTVALINGALKLMAWTRYKIAAIGMVAVLVTTTSLVMISRRHEPEVDTSRPASGPEIQQLFDLATTRPARSRFEADIEVMTPPYTTEQIKKALADVETFVQRDNARLNPRQKAEWRVNESNAIVKAHSGRRILHVREWFSGNYYRLDLNDEGAGVERFMQAHPGEYRETWVKIPGSPFSPYGSYLVNRELRDLMMFKQVEPIAQFDLWQALSVNVQVAGIFAGALSLRDTNAQKRAAFDYSGLKIDPVKAEQLRSGTARSWRLQAIDETLDGRAATHFILRFIWPRDLKTPPGFRPEVFQGEMWIGQVSGRTVCLQELQTNFTEHTSVFVRDKQYDADGVPTGLTMTTVKADSSVETQHVVFKRIEPDPSFTDEEAFAPVYSPDYIVSDASSPGPSVILHNPHPEIPIAK